MDGTHSTAVNNNALQAVDMCFPCLCQVRTCVLRATTVQNYSPQQQSIAI